MLRSRRPQSAYLASRTLAPKLAMRRKPLPERVSLPTGESWHTLAHQMTWNKSSHTFHTQGMASQSDSPIVLFP